MAHLKIAACISGMKNNKKRASGLKRKVIFYAADTGIG